MAYSGHQFGHFSEVLGDGRAIVIAENIQLKGAGPTPFSYRGDGLSALGPVIREYLISEAMHTLGVPTTRSLAAVETGELVQRETLLPGGILTRVSSCFIRIGTFEFIRAHGSVGQLKTLADYCIQTYYPEYSQSTSQYLDFFNRVLEENAKLVAKWMSLGFIHGVMNTDNISILGETLDYGPCAFMDEYDPKTVFSYIDRYGRYAYQNQPNIMKWNLTRFSETLLPLIQDNSSIEEMIEKFDIMYKKYWIEEMSQKLGINVGDYK